MIDGARFAVFEDLIGTFLVRARSCPASSASRITRLIQTSFSVFAVFGFLESGWHPEKVGKYLQAGALDL